MVSDEKTVQMRIDSAAKVILPILSTYTSKREKVIEEATKIAEKLKLEHLLDYREKYFASLADLSNEFQGKNYSDRKTRKELCGRIKETGSPTDSFCMCIFNDILKMINLGRDSLPRKKATIRLANALCELTESERLAAYHLAWALYEAKKSA